MDTANAEAFTQYIRPHNSRFSNILENNVYIRNWSLITGNGRLQNWRGGGDVKFYPYEKGGGERF